MQATFTDEDGNEKEFVMGCYGIGVGRTVAAAIEQSYYSNGIIFPMPIAPFHVLLLPVNLKNDLIKYHNGKLPKNVSDAWKTEEDYTEYRISKLR